jgi:hypothetical protein
MHGTQVDLLLQLAGMHKRENLQMIANLGSRILSLGGHGWNDSRQSFNTIKANTNGSIPHQHFFDMNKFLLLTGLRSFQIHLANEL